MPSCFHLGVGDDLVSTGRASIVKCYNFYIIRPVFRYSDPPTANTHNDCKRQNDKIVKKKFLSIGELNPGLQRIKLLFNDKLAY